MSRDGPDASVAAAARSPRGPAAPAQSTSAQPTSVADLLLTSLAALAEAGEVEHACRLAGQACVRLRHVAPATARRFDVLLHRLTPALTW
ncbi:MAG TPA: hypothetical protein VNQ31_00930 [Sphingomonadaceae bacterium]|nr:hypothetical protein [Sphingomonadaceae bacterium]